MIHSPKQKWKRAAELGYDSNAHIVPVMSRCEDIKKKSKQRQFWLVVGPPLCKI